MLTNLKNKMGNFFNSNLLIIIRIIRIRVFVVLSCTQCCYLLKKFNLSDSIIKRDLSYRKKKSWSISQQFLTVTSFFHVSSHDASIWTFNHNVFRKIYLSESQLDWWQSQHFVIIIYLAHPSSQQKINIFCNLSLFCLTSQRRQP